MPSFRTFIAPVGLSLLLAAPLSAQTLRGSRASVDLMYTTAHTHDLAFLKTPQDVYAAAAAGALELVSVTKDLDLRKVAYPFVLPNTRRFADSLAAKYHAACGQRLEMTSGARPIDQQPRNASPESVHPTGMAIDFHKPAGACLTWLRRSLVDLENAHVIEATEERHPPHFHVAVLSQLREPPIRMVASAAPAAPPAASPALSPASAKSASKAAATSRSPVTAQKAVAAAQATSDVSLASTKVTSYKIRAGDNLWTIAERHNTTADDLKKLNGLRSSRIKVGQEIRLR